MGDQFRDSRGRFSSGGSMGKQPVTSHGNAPSIHTRLRTAAAEKIALGRAQDERRYPSRSGNDVAQMQDFVGTRTAPGKIDPRVNDAVRKIIRGV